MNEYGTVTEYTQTPSGDVIENTREPTGKEMVEAGRRVRALLACMGDSEPNHG